MSFKSLIKITFPALVLLASISSLSLAQAQTSSTTCIVLNNNLRYGSSDYTSNGEVTKLQVFLNRSGYFPYTPIGYFGSLTFRAVQNFQASHNLPATGYVGPLTRIAIQQSSCNGGIVPPSQQTVTIQRLSTSVGLPGTTVIVYGTGFTSDNSIYLGSNLVNRLSANNATSVSFVVPSSLANGTYALTIQNVTGTSNPVSFSIQSQSTQTQAPTISSVTGPVQLATNQIGTWTIQASSQLSVGGQLSYSVNWGDGSNNPVYNQSSYAVSVGSTGSFTHAYQGLGTFTPVFTVTDQYGRSATASASVVISGQQQSQTPTIQSLSATSLLDGSSLTVYGSGFTANNTVLIDGRAYAHLNSSNGTSLVITRISSTDVCSYSSYATSCWIPTLGAHVLSVSNENGTSNSVNFSLVSNANQNLAPSIQSMSPTSGSVYPGSTGPIVTIYGSNLNDGLNPGGTGIDRVRFNGYDSAYGTVSSNGTSLTFQVPQYLNGIDVGGTSNIPLVPGVYSVSVYNRYGSSNSLQFTVVSNQTAAPSIQTLSPASVSTGSTVIIYGTGFTASNNTILMGNGVAASGLTSSGNTLSFTVPNTISPNCSANSMCPNWIQNVTSGTYPISVQNSNGTSNSVNLAVNSGSISQLGPSIQYLSPSASPAGSMVTIYGSGFTPSGNSVLLSSQPTAGIVSIASHLFNNETVASNLSSDGTSLSFTVPSSLCSRFLTPTDVSWCQQVSLSVGSSYAISVSNQNGTSNSMLFTVTQSSATRLPL